MGKRGALYRLGHIYTKHNGAHNGQSDLDANLRSRLTVGRQNRLQQLLLGYNIERVSVAIWRMAIASCIFNMKQRRLELEMGGCALLA